MYIPKFNIMNKFKMQQGFNTKICYLYIHYKFIKIIFYTLNISKNSIIWITI